MKVRQPKYPDEIRFSVYGHAIPKARARVVSKRKDKKTGKLKELDKPHSFTPTTTVEWEASIYGQSLASKPPRPWDGGVALGVLFFKRIPKNKQSKFHKSEGKLRPVSARDDLDNLIKALKDALNGIYWLDDGQVVEYTDIDGIQTGKYFSDTPRVEVRVVFLRDPA